MMQVQQGWKAQDLADTTRWIYRLGEDEIGEIDAALNTAKDQHLDFQSLTKERFPLPTMRATLDRVLDELETGLGFFVLRGLPAKRYSKDDMRLIYWGIGLNMGTAVTQSNRGDLLGDVKNFGVDTFGAKGRGYMSNQHLQFHADSADVVCLMVLRVAKVGGLSRFASTIAIHDEIARSRPDLLETLFQPYYMSWKGQERPGDKPYYRQPLFSMENGKLAARFIPQHVIGYNAEQLDELPPPSPRQIEAVEAVLALANDPAFYGEMMFEPGDMQFMNNHVMLHSRTEFEDYDEPDRRRHLIRLWLSVPNSRKLHDSMDAIYRDGAPGAVRGGFPSFTGQRLYETPTITD